LLQTEFIKLCTVNSLPQNRGVRVIIENKELAVFRVGEDVYVLNNICPHNHIAKIFEGEIRDGSVACPIHGWTFELKTGKSTCGMSNILAFETKIQSGEVWVKIKNRI